MEFPVEFKKCYYCGCETTIALQAMENETPKPTNPNMLIEKKLTPIQDFTRISTPTTKVVIRYYDTCSKCGTERCIKAETGTIPTDILMSMMGIAPTPMPKR